MNNCTLVKWLYLILLTPTCFSRFCDRHQGAVARVLLKYKQIARLHNFTSAHVLVNCMSVNTCLLHGIGTY